MNILHLRAGTSSGGADRLILSCLKRCKFPDSKMYLTGIVKKKDRKSYVVEHARKNGINGLYLYYRWKFGVYCLFSLVKFIKKNNISIVHTHGYRENVLGLLASCFCRIRIISTIHGWTSEGWRKKIDKMIIKRFDKITAPSGMILQELADTGIDGNKLVLLRNCIDTERFTGKTDTEKLKYEYNVREDTFIITYIGRLSKVKGVDYLLTAISQLPKDKFKVIVTGSGEQSEDLKTMVSNLALEDSVIFTGNREDIEIILKMSDVLVQPSLSEGFPLTILEAMYYNVPVIASNVGGIPEIIKNGETGILVKPENPEELRKAVLLLSENKILRDKLIKNSHEMVTENYLIEHYCHELGNIYRSLTEPEN